MFERYTESARRVLFFARYEASELGGAAISADHLLLGLTREAKGVVCEVFALSHASLKAVRQAIEARAASGVKHGTSVELPFENDAKRVLQFAAEEADRLRHPYIGTEHLLLGLLREEGSPAAATLAGQGLRVDEVRAAVARLSAPPEDAHAVARHAEVFEVERIQGLLDDLSRKLADPVDTAAARDLAQQIMCELAALKTRLDV
jgi:ATP-dependent Clp protease ATP-binding subunit ClpC